MALFDLYDGHMALFDLYDGHMALCTAMWTCLRPGVRPCGPVYGPGYY